MNETMVFTWLLMLTAGVTGFALRKLGGELFVPKLNYCHPHWVTLICLVIFLGVLFALDWVVLANTAPWPPEVYRDLIREKISGAVGVLLGALTTYLAQGRPHEH